MTSFHRCIVGAVVWIFCVWVSAAADQTLPYKDRYDQEQVLLAKLMAGNTAEDQRQLAALLRDGVMAGADNPLRRSDRAGAIKAYRRAIALGDRSEGTFVALARLLLRESDSQGFADMRPALRKLILQGNGDAAYIMALDSMQNGKLPKSEVDQKLEAAAVMGSVPAVIDLVGAGTPIGATAKAASLETLNRRALDGWAPASYALYEIYKEGRVVPPSPQSAMKWLQLAVEQGHVTAIERLANHFLTGSNVAVNAARAVELYRKAAEAGSGAAALMLGRSMSAKPDSGVSIDEGRLWLRRATEIGFRGAAAELTNFELSVAISSDVNPAAKAGMIEAALAPIAQDPEALATLANRYWKTDLSDLIGPTLMPLLKTQALEGRPATGLAYNAWLQASGQPLSTEIAQALVRGLKDRPLVSEAFSDFTIANLVLDQRIPEDIVSKPEAFNLLFKAADEKVGQAMLRIGQLYQQGDRLAQSRFFATHWFTQAKLQGVERASWDLAALQLTDDDEPTRSKAERFYLEQLREGDMRAGLILIRYRLLDGRVDAATLAEVGRAAQQPGDIIQLAKLLAASGTKENILIAKQLLSKISEQQLDAETLVAYGDLLMRSASSEEEKEHGLQILIQAAEAGTADSRIALASAYLSSVSYKDRQASAVQLLSGVLAADARNQDARLLLSKAYLMGLGTTKDARKASDLVAGIRAEGEYHNPKATMLAADWLAFSIHDRDPAAYISLLKTQAARGSVAAERAIGEAYLSGFGPSLQPDSAATRLYSAAHAGDKEAMAALGHLLLSGYGVSQSKTAAVEWLSRSAEAGNAAAMYELSRIYALEPSGVEDEKRALQWLTRAAEGNHPNASYLLGMAYLKGERLPVDINRATALFARSAASGNLLAARTLEALRKQNTTDGITGIPDPARE